MIYYFLKYQHNHPPICLSDIPSNKLTTLTNPISHSKVKTTELHLPSLPYATYLHQLASLLSHSPIINLIKVLQVSYIQFPPHVIYAFASSKLVSSPRKCPHTLPSEFYFTCPLPHGSISIQELEKLSLKS